MGIISTSGINFYIIYSVKSSIFKDPWRTRLANALNDFQGRNGETQRKRVRCAGDSPGFWLAPHLLPAAEVLVRQGPFNGELCWERFFFFFFPGLKLKKQDQSILSKWIKELIRKVWLCCSDQNLLRLLNGIMLCQRGKRVFFPHWFLSGGHCSALWKIRKKYTQWIYRKVFSRVWWGTLPIPLQGQEGRGGFIGLCLSSPFFLLFSSLYMHRNSLLFQ